MLYHQWITAERNVPHSDHLFRVDTMAPLENVGYWGEPTSTIDWCERNYEVSFYIAEMCK